MATLALFLAAGGGAVWAAGKVGGDGKAGTGVSVKRISIATNEGNAVTGQKLLADSGTGAFLVCSTGLPELLYDHGAPGKATLNVAIYKDGAAPVLHDVAAVADDPLPANFAGADVSLTLRAKDGTVKLARFTFQYRPNGFGTQHDCFAEGTLTKFG